MSHQPFLELICKNNSFFIISHFISHFFKKKFRVDPSIARTRNAKAVIYCTDSLAEYFSPKIIGNFIEKHYFCIDKCRKM